MSVDYQAARFLKATWNGDISIEPCFWWKNSEKRFSHVAFVVIDVLAVQTSSVSSEGTVSLAINMIGNHLASLGNDFINVSGFAQYWFVLVNKSLKTHTKLNGLQYSRWLGLDLALLWSVQF